MDAGYTLAIKTCLLIYSFTAPWYLLEPLLVFCVIQAFLNYFIMQHARSWLVSSSLPLKHLFSLTFDIRMQAAFAGTMREIRPNPCPFLSVS